MNVKEIIKWCLVAAGLAAGLSALLIFAAWDGPYGWRLHQYDCHQSCYR
jgi:hypothetical protein